MQNEGMCHLDAVRLHWMLVAVMVVANFWVIEVCHLSTRPNIPNSEVHTTGVSLDASHVDKLVGSVSVIHSARRSGSRMAK